MQTRSQLKPHGHVSIGAYHCIQELSRHYNAVPRSLLGRLCCRAGRSTQACSCASPFRKSVRRGSLRTSTSESGRLPSWYFSRRVISAPRYFWQNLATSLRRG